MKTKAIETQEIKTDKMEVIKAIAISLFSFIFGGGTLLGIISPFGVAFVAAVPLKYLLTACIGSGLSLIIFSPGISSGFLIGAMLIVAATRFFMARATKFQLKPFFIAIITFFAVLLTTFVRISMNNSGIVDILFMFIEIMLSGCFAYFFAICSETFLKARTSPVLSYIQLTALSIFLITAICSATKYQISNINIGIIFAIILIYIVTNRYGILGSCVASIGVALAITLSSITLLSLAGIIVIAGFFAGVFSPLGKFFQFSSFIIIASFCALLMGAPNDMIGYVIDIFIATAIYILTPQRILSRLELRPNNGALTNKLLPQGVAMKLNFASDTVTSLRADLERVSNTFSDIEHNNIGSISDVAANHVCKGCSKALDCWDTNYNEIADAFIPIKDRLKSIGEIDEKSMPPYFINKCCKLTPLINTINEYYSAFLAKQTAKLQLKSSRQIVFEQFSSLADMLCEMSEELNDTTGYDEAMARQALAGFTKLEQEPLQLIAALDKSGRAIIEIYTQNTIKTSKSVLCETISNATNRIFELPSIITSENKTKLSFFEKANLDIEYSVQQSCNGDNKVCGDTFESFTSAKGYAYFLLSDGMGTGTRAAIDSVMTCSIMAKLLKAGFGISSTLKLLNSALLVKSTDESLSTIDMTQIDLYTGETVLVKAGAATSFVLLDGEVSRIDASALPIGIIQPAECAKNLLTLGKNDVLVLVSDGATANGESYLVDMLKQHQNKSAKEIATILCNEAKKREEGNHDDITIVVIKIV